MFFFKERTYMHLVILQTFPLVLQQAHPWKRFHHPKIWKYNLQICNTNIPMGGGHWSDVERRWHRWHNLCVIWQEPGAFTSVGWCLKKRPPYSSLVPYWDPSLPNSLCHLKLPQPSSYHQLVCAYLPCFPFFSSSSFHLLLSQLHLLLSQLQLIHLPLSLLLLLPCWNRCHELLASEINKRISWLFGLLDCMIANQCCCHLSSVCLSCHGGRMRWDIIGHGRTAEGIFRIKDKLSSSAVVKMKINKE